MPLPVPKQTTVTIVGTVLAAAGLNLGVLGLVAPDETPIEPTVTAGPSVEVTPTDLVAAPASGVPPAGVTAASAPEAVAQGGAPGAAAGSSSTTGATSTAPALPSAPQPTATQPAPTARPTSTTWTGADAPTVEYLAYDFTGVATIYIELIGGRQLKYHSVVRESGWVSRVEDDSPNLVKVKFMRLSDGEEAEFQVRFIDGELKVKMEL